MVATAPAAPRAPARRPTPLQIGLFVLSAVNTAWALAGLLANPDFATGSAVTSVQVLGVDFNGWHAVAGLLAFAPGLLVARSHRLSRVYVSALIPLGLVIPGLWALADSRPMGLWPFEHPSADAVLHLSNGAVYAGLLAFTARSNEPRAPGSEGRRPRRSARRSGAGRRGRT